MRTRETKFGTYIEMETETSTKLTGDKITVFVERLKKIGIEVKLVGNFPWVYITEICGKRVTEKFAGNHGFTLIFLPLFLIGWFAGSGSLSVIILAQTSYSLFRTICYGYKVHTSLIDELKKQILLEKEEEDHSDDSTNSSTNIELIDSPIHRIDHNS
jgi:hypothetical protein